MAEYRFTEYFEQEVLRKRPYLKKEWGSRYWNRRYDLSLRRITDTAFGRKLRPWRVAISGSLLFKTKVTIHNAFPDRRMSANSICPPTASASRYRQDLRQRPKPVPCASPSCSTSSPPMIPSEPRPASATLGSCNLRGNSRKFVVKPLPRISLISSYLRYLRPESVSLI